MEDEYRELRSGGIKGVDEALRQSEQLLSQARQHSLEIQSARQLVQSPVSRSVPRPPTEFLIESLAVPTLSVADLIEKLSAASNSPRKPLNHLLPGTTSYPPTNAPTHPAHHPPNTPHPLSNPNQPSYVKETSGGAGMRRKPPSHFYRNFRRLNAPIEFDFRHL